MACQFGRLGQDCEVFQYKIKQITGPGNKNQFLHCRFTMNLTKSVKSQSAVMLQFAELSNFAHSRTTLSKESLRDIQVRELFLEHQNFHVNNLFFLAVATHC